MKLSKLILILGAANLFAAQPTIVGAWHLDLWKVLSKQGAENEFCKGGKGILIYERSGYVSTSINCPATKGVVAEPADEYQRMFFYAGTYTVKDGLITKRVSNASAEGLLGKTVLRNIEKLTEKELILTGPFGPRGDTLWIRWTR